MNREQLIFDGLNIIAFILAVVIHEYAHGYVALKMGDPTAKMAGRLTLNPLAHVDPIGLLFILVFKIGWAKGVPINPYNFRDYKKGTILVSLAGVGANFFMALVSILLYKYFPINNMYLNTIFIMFANVNLVLGIFNLIPIPPLDGSRVVSVFLPQKLRELSYKYERYSFFIVLALVYFGVIPRFLNTTINMIYGLIL